MSPLPRHLLESLYLAGDKEAFANSARFTDDFVGLGPFKMVRWERGSHVELARYNEYFQGRAPLDGVVVRYITDPNTMVANILSGAVDLLLPPSVDLDMALALKAQREASALGVIGARLEETAEGLRAQARHQAGDPLAGSRLPPAGPGGDLRGHPAEVVENHPVVGGLPDLVVDGPGDDQWIGSLG